jgi:hypothetical protein
MCRKAAISARMRNSKTILIFAGSAGLLLAAYFFVFPPFENPYVSLAYRAINDGKDTLSIRIGYCPSKITVSNGKTCVDLKICPGGVGGDATVCFSEKTRALLSIKYDGE